MIKLLALHKDYVEADAFKALCAVGGLEIAAMTGAYIRCAQIGLPIIVDGFISTVSALVAVRLNQLYVIGCYLDINLQNMVTAVC